MGTLYQKVFTGEIAPVVINKDSVSVANPTFPELETYDCVELPLIKWRDIALKHLPNNANLSTVECEFRLEYLHFDYVIPSRVSVPSSGLPEYGSRETVTAKQTKSVAFKAKYNRVGNYAFEFRLLKNYDSNFTLDSVTPYTNQIAYDVELNYPIGDLIYDNGLPGFIDLIPFLVKNGNLTFADIKQELRVQILPKLDTGDVLIFGGGYSGSVTYELNKSLIEVTVNEDMILNGLTPVQILESNQDRYGFYLSNNSDSVVYYSFGFMSSSSAKLTLKPGETLVSEDGKLTLNNSDIDPGDSRYLLNLPLWVRGSVVDGSQQVSIEEISYA